jgi:hypothetical protein
VEADPTADLGHAWEFTAIDHAVHSLSADAKKLGDFIHAQKVRELMCIAACPSRVHLCSILAYPALSKQAGRVTGLRPSASVTARPA